MNLWRDQQLEREIDEIGRVGHRRAMYYFTALFLAAIDAAAVAVLAVPPLRMLLPMPLGLVVSHVITPAIVAIVMIAIVASGLYVASRRRSS